MDKRRYRRIEFHASAEITKNGNTVTGEVKNLGNKGILVKAHGEFQPDDTTLVSVNFSDGKTTMSVTMPGKIARLTDDGIAIHSPHINLYPILHLEHLFIFHKDKPKDLTVDFCEYISAITPWN